MLIYHSPSLKFLTHHAQGIYPTAVIIIVHNGVSALDSVIISRNAPVSSLQFAGHPWSHQVSAALNQDMVDSESGDVCRHGVQETGSEEVIGGKGLV